MGPRSALCSGLLGCGGEPDRPQPPTLHALPDFSALDQAGQPFTPSQLDGQVWVANFVFTDCPSVCPMLTAQMGNFQRRMTPLAPALRYVSISVDPVQDTPPRAGRVRRPPPGQPEHLALPDPGRPRSHH